MRGRLGFQDAGSRWSEGGRRVKFRVFGVLGKEAKSRS